MNDEFDISEEKSKSQLKREATALQELGEELVNLKPAHLADMPLSERLREAVDTARAITKHGGRKRQLQYIGKLMRSEDAEPIRAALERLREGNRFAAARLHRLEQWRERLIEEGDGALAELLDEGPALDRQQLRQLIRNAVKERATGKPAGAGRALFRFLRDALTED